MKHSKSSLFLMEIIISILFFSIAGALCAQMFAKSHTISEVTVQKNNAITQAQNFAELWLASEGNYANIYKTVANPNITYDDTSLVCCYNNQWEICNKEGASFLLILTNTSPEAELQGASLKVLSKDATSDSNMILSSDTNSSDSLYSLSLVYHVAERKNGNE